MQSLHQLHCAVNHLIIAAALTRVNGRLLAGDSGDAIMMEVFDEIVGPAAERFQPDIILVRTCQSGSLDGYRDAVLESL